MQPVFKFSPELRAEAIAYFEKRFETPVSNEEADLYLAQLAELAIALEAVESRRLGSPPPAAAPGGFPASPLLADSVPVSFPLLRLDKRHT